MQLGSALDTLQVIVVVAGDFNDHHEADNKSRAPPNKKSCNEFENFISECRLREILIFSGIFIWTIGVGGTKVTTSWIFINQKDNKLTIFLLDLKF